MQIERISGKYGKKIILIDDEDFEKLKGWNLYVVYHSASKNFCAKLYRYEHGKQISVYLHRFLLDCGTADVVQHLNENTLDCRRFNIKKITHSDKLKIARSHSRKRI